MYLILNLKKRLLLLLCIFLVAFFIVSVISGVVMWKFGASTPAMRIVTVIQDVVLFILPALVTALLVTRQPATLLCLDRRPNTNALLIAVWTLLLAFPAMNFVIWLNLNIPIPDDLAAALRGMEDNAAEAVKALIGPHNVPNLIMSILIVGVLAGVSEEILFRGGLQRLLVTGGVNHHIAIWITAVIFSMVHMQFYGFVPRMLLGAFFGYTLLWTHSLWVPIILHALNNTIYIIGEYANYGEEETSVLESFGQGKDYLYVVLSLIATVLLLRSLYHYCKQHNLAS